MTDEELIARLLDWEEYDEGHINDAREAAANRIKELKAELAGGSFYQEKDIDALQDRLAAQAAEIERLRGDLKKAEWLLVDASVQLDEGKVKTRRNRASLIRQFLAELTGDKT